MLNFKYDSLNAKLYRWFYDVRRMPNLCPYFWKSIIMWILIVPYELIVLPGHLRLIIWRDKVLDDKPDEITFGVIGHVAIQFGIAFLYFWYNVLFLHNQGANANGSVGVYYAIGFVTTLGLVIGGAIALGVVLKQKSDKKKLDAYLEENDGKFPWNDEHLKRNKKPSLIIEGIKAWYQNSCPQINWEGQPKPFAFPVTDPDSPIYDPESPIYNEVQEAE